MWSREVQTDLGGLELPDADQIAKTIKKDIELSRAIMKATSKKMKDLETKYEVRLRVVEKQLKLKLRNDINSAYAAFESQNEKIITERSLEMKMIVERQRRILEKFQTLHRNATPEHQALKYKAAKMYLKLKRRQLPDDLETSALVDAEKTDFVAHIDRLRHEIRLCEDDIHALQPKLFKMEEMVDKNKDRKIDATNVFATKKFKFDEDRVDTTSSYSSEESAFAADDTTKTYVKQKMIHDYESLLKETIEKQTQEYEELQKTVERSAAHWDIKFKSVNEKKVTLLNLM
ncbi:UNVERIFIED_CONTAM: hypothetical protein HDU68_008212 [Siphonaria sp. JEL0065]|nr:hypothetical protein HDU68_008212 [Siphonaria sp. JEL0065]